LITVYAAAAFVILELLSIIIEPLRLPDWTLQFAIVFLCIGLIVAIILSWSYDIHPEGGIVKTEPVNKVKEERIPSSSNSWRIASYISFVVIVALIVLHIIPRSNRLKENEILDKSIAVLPFINDSPDQENEYFINGTMETILNKLCKISDLKVVSRSSVEKYRDTVVPIPEVAEKLVVSYILEGSMQRYGDRIRLTLQLIDRNDKHIWSEQYDREILEVEELLTLQSNIAQLVAREIEAVVTQEEKVLIEKIPTRSLTAYDFYLKGNQVIYDDIITYRSSHYTYGKEGFIRAEHLYQMALNYDSTFAPAYAGLGKVYLMKYYWELYFTDDFEDSILAVTDIALSYDNQLSDAYVVRGDYYREKGNDQKALKAYHAALLYTPNNWLAYYGLGQIGDVINALENLQKAATLNPGPELPALLRSIGLNYSIMGFNNKAFQYAEEAFQLDGDSIEHYFLIHWYNFCNGDLDLAITNLEKVYSRDCDNLNTLMYLGIWFSVLGNHKQAIVYLNEYLDKLKADRIELTSSQRIGHILWNNGFKEDANYYFDKQIEYCKSTIELDRPRAQLSYFDLAGVYAFRGEVDRALESLRTFSEYPYMPVYMVVWIHIDPLLNGLRDKPEFQQIVRDVEAKYQSEHERVRQWLEKNAML